MSIVNQLKFPPRPQPQIWLSGQYAVSNSISQSPKILLKKKIGEAFSGWICQGESSFEMASSPILPCSIHGPWSVGKPTTSCAGANFGNCNTHGRLSCTEKTRLFASRELLDTPMGLPKTSFLSTKEWGGNLTKHDEKRNSWRICNMKCTCEIEEKKTLLFKAYSLVGFKNLLTKISYLN